MDEMSRWDIFFLPANTAMTVVVTVFVILHISDSAYIVGITIVYCWSIPEVIDGIKKIRRASKKKAPIDNSAKAAE